MVAGSQQSFGARVWSTENNSVLDDLTGADGLVVNSLGIQTVVTSKTGSVDKKKQGEY